MYKELQTKLCKNDTQKQMYLYNLIVLNLNIKMTETFKQVIVTFNIERNYCRKMSIYLHVKHHFASNQVTHVRTALKIYAHFKTFYI